MIQMSLHTFLSLIEYLETVYFCQQILKPISNRTCFIIFKRINTLMTFSQSKHFPVLSFHKIHFSISKKVSFGQAVYVCGSIPHLGSWEISKSFRLKWNQGNIWSGSLLLTSATKTEVEYKYVVADYSDPKQNQLEWQAGKHNRCVLLDQPKSTIICDDRWNMDRISLILNTSSQGVQQKQKYYVAGNILELGGNQQKKLMKPLSKQNYHLYNLKQELKNKKSIYIYSFYTYRGKQSFKYYYQRKRGILQKQRQPGRIFYFEKERQHQSHPHRKEVLNSKGDIFIVDQINLSSIIYSQVTDHMLVGNYPKTALDFQILKQERVTAVLSIQSQIDFQKHGLTVNFVQHLCQHKSIKYKVVSIEDMNPQEFVCKSLSGVKVLRDWLKRGQRVYVHCSAGMYRSPQMIALYLSIFERYSVEEAVKIVQNQHPHAKPSCKIIQDTLALLNLHRSRAKIVSQY